MLNKGTVSQIFDVLNKPSNVLIIPHVHPDADAIGSSLATQFYLQKYQHRVQIISPDGYPIFLNWMPEVDKILVYKKETEAQITELFEQAHLIIHIDHSQLSRCGQLAKFSQKSSSPKLMIDHHIGKEDFADFEIWNTHAAASAELVFEMMVYFGDEGMIDKQIASCIYAGLVTDTGCFKHSNVTPRVHQIAAELLSYGIDFALIHHLIYDSNSEDRMRFLGFALSEKLKVLHSYGVAYFTISQSELERFNYQSGDTEGVVNYALSIQDIKMAALFTEQEGAIRISFRSFGSFNVAEFSKNYFGGGGHFNAAGAKLEHNRLQEAEAYFLEVLEKYKYQIANS
jgi:phosphoesterase RecJ-like protein